MSTKSLTRKLKSPRIIPFNDSNNNEIIKKLYKSDLKSIKEPRQFLKKKKYNRNLIRDISKSIGLDKVDITNHI